jgi:hypothetical protein
MRRWLLLLVPVTIACTMPAATVSTVSGSYTGKYGGATEDFELRVDGTYTQTLHADKDYANAGKWRIERARSGYDFIKFASFAKALDLTGKKLVVPPEKYYGETEGMWIAGQGPESIVFDIDSGYVIDKRK